MDYSVKDVINKINDEWFLPAIQRPYVWGSRYDEEKYICRLFDSILKEYPIGLFILWKPQKNMAFRQFLEDFEEDNAYKPKDEQDFKITSSLVYDGQQRLQTLYSCLKHSFKGRKLVFNLRYKRDSIEEGHDTGFHFIDENDKMGLFDVRLTTVFNLQDDDAKINLRNSYKSKTNEQEQQNLIEKNLDKLYNVFSNINHVTPSISVFEIKGVSEDEVNDIFQRLNMGGVQLSNADLLFSRIKEVYPQFESQIIEFTKKLSKGDNATISAYDVLQVINIIVKGQTKINPEFNKGQAGKRERELFVECWEKLREPLKDTMVRYLSGHLNINRMQIMPRKMPLLALIVYMYYLYIEKGNYVEQERNNGWLQNVDKFFITAELNDWSLQSYIDAFARIFKNQKDKKSFPLEEIIDWVRKKGNRSIDLIENTFCGYRWFALKVVLRDTRFTFKDDMTKRFNPELDHIFPIHLPGTDKDYRKNVDVIWNMQPISGDINIDKSNYNPYDYFMGNIKGHEYGKDFYCKYQEMPPLGDLSLWQDYKIFVEWRKKRFIELMKKQYDLDIKCEQKQDVLQQISQDNNVEDTSISEQIKKLKTIEEIETPEDLEKIKEKAEAIIRKHRENPQGSLSHFIEQCKSSQRLEKDGLKGEPE